MNVLRKRNPNKKIVCIIALFHIILNVYAQNDKSKVAIMFYNAENFYDWFNNPLSNDDEFTQEGARHWTAKKFNSKLQNLSKVILAATGWTPPAIVGLCEIENRDVLEKLISKTPLKSIPFSIIHKESPDPRGIDVAILYNREIFIPISYLYYPLKLKNDSILKTREILHVTGWITPNDTLHIFINHWPSRYSGLLESKSLRNDAASLLKSKTDSILKINPYSKIVIMGDFNDQPQDESLQNELNAMPVTGNLNNANLYNLSFYWNKDGTGTLKFQSQWSVFDQIIVSGNLLNSKLGYYTKPENASIVKLPFLFEKDEQYGGQKLKRTFTGFSYNGGFSDHLPIILKLDKKTN